MICNLASTLEDDAFCQLPSDHSGPHCHNDGDMYYIWMFSGFDELDVGYYKTLEYDTIAFETQEVIDEYT